MVTQGHAVTYHRYRAGTGACGGVLGLASLLSHWEQGKHGERRLLSSRRLHGRVAHPSIGDAARSSRPLGGHDITLRQEKSLCRHGFIGNSRPTPFAAGRYRVGGGALPPAAAFRPAAHTP